MLLWLIVLIKVNLELGKEILEGSKMGMFVVKKDLCIKTKVGN